MVSDSWGMLYMIFSFFPVTEAQNVVSMGWAPIQLSFFAVHFKNSDLQPIKNSETFMYC